jgi:hypothetical protein
MTENTTERAVESEIADTPLAPAIAEAPAAPAAARDDDVERNTRATIGVDRAALGRKFAERRAAAEDDIAFAGSFAPDELRAGRLTQETPEATDETAPDAPAEDASDAELPRHRLVVRREEREVDQNELLRLAQIGAAGESYLAETKSLRDEAAALRNIALHPHPDAQSASQSDEPPIADDPLKTIVEKIQYGPPEEAADALREVITRAQDPEATRKAIYLHQREIDVGRAKSAYQAFAAKADNAALLRDRRNELVMQDLYYEEVARDLRALGLPTDQIPADRPRLVETHRFHRIHGQRVRDTQSLLEASREAFLDWRGGRNRDNTSAAPRPSTIAVNVDRSARRAAIPPQPARAAAPQRQEAARAVPTSRSAAVDKMLQGRRRAIVT